MKTVTNPNDEIRMTKEAQSPNTEKAVMPVPGNFYPRRAKAFRASAFGFLSAFGIWHLAFTLA
jgi:hypothetical protein